MQNLISFFFERSCFRKSKRYLCQIRSEKMPWKKQKKIIMFVSSHVVEQLMMPRGSSLNYLSRNFIINAYLKESINITERDKKID